MTIRVGYRDFAVEDWNRQTAVSAERYGECDKNYGIIRVSTDYGPHRTAATLIHETLHACYAVSGLADKEPEEKVVTVLSQVLAQVIRDNPDFVAYLSEALRP